MVVTMDLSGATSRDLPPPQKINSLSGNNNSKPTGQAATSFACELAELSEIISNDGDKKILEQIVKNIGAGLDMIKAQSLFNRIIDETRILLDKAIPSRPLPS